MKQSRTRAIRTPAKRRGTVIVLALAVLAILAIAAVAYVSVVRIDRESSVASAQRSNYEQQVNAVVSHIGSLLAADLFGNKIVTNAVPQTIRGNVRVWPRAFEDSESWDYPTTDVFWRNPAQTTEDLPLDPADINVERRVARPDDAWLAALEPRWNYANLDNTRYWPQITNLRSAYTWNQRSNQWERGDGRYVDLLQWYLNARNGRANAALNLTEFGNGNIPMGPAFGFDNGTNSRLTDVFDKQIAELDFSDPATAPREAVEPSDERMWVDTDGDLRPDARWQQLDALGNLFGLNWVVAARVIDASALVNVQTAVEFPYEANFGIPTPPSFGRQFVDVMGTGKTPADVDLLRLLSYGTINYPGEQNTRPGIFDANISINQMNGQFEEHLRLSLGAESVFNDLRETNGTYPDDAAFQSDPKQQYAPWLRQNPLTRIQREALFSYATSTIERPLTPAATSYPRRDMLDLFSFHATNNTSVLSKVEQLFDGPESNQGYLPDADSSDPVTAFGPLRSAEFAADVRRFDTGDASNPPEPSVQRIKMDIRRHLTMVNGVGQISPVPVINDAIRNRADSFDSQYSQQKIRLSQLTGLSHTRTADQDLVQRVFGSLVWALAPLATNQPLMPGVARNQTGTAEEPDDTAHYGGGIGTTSPADEFRLSIPSPLSEVGASYAILRAAAMTANLLDAMDADGGSSQNAVPTAIRLVNSVDPQATIAGNPPGFEIGTRLTQGDIPAAILPPEYVGPANAGMTLFGLDRQPFLREAHALAVYQDQDWLSGSTANVVTIDPATREEQAGSLMAFEIGNPWPTPLNLEFYKLRIQTDASTYMEFDLADIDTSGSTGDGVLPTVDAGERVVFYWQKGNGYFTDGTLTTWDLVMDDATNGWRSQIRANGIVTLKLNDAAVRVGPDLYSDATHGFVPFSNFGSGTAVVLLIRKQSGGMPSEVLVDRMSAPVSTTTPFPASLETAYPLDISAINDGNTIQCTGRIAIASTLHRHTEHNSFPAYVIERRSQNVVLANTPGGTPGVMEQKWRIIPSDAGVPHTIAQDLLAEPQFDANCWIGEPKGTMSVPLAAFQLFVPDRSLEYLSELLLVSPFCHMYVHQDINGAPNTGTPLTTDAWSMNAGRQPWTTFSEQLGSDGEMFIDGIGATLPNQYLGLLDPSRYILNGPEMLYSGRDLPDALTVPLALRVVEPFEALSPRTNTTMIQGRININTASPEVVGCLPLMAPQYNIPNTGSASGGLDQIVDAINPVNGRPEPLTRVATLLRYRDRFGVNDNPDSGLTPDAHLPSDLTLTGLSGLRGYANDSFSYSNARIARGLTTTAELAILQPWDITNTPRSGRLEQTVAQSNLAAQYFLQLGGDLRDASSNAGQGTINQLDTYNPQYGLTGAMVDGDLNVIDDPEERLAIYRAISNIVTTRSDVFIAWFILRGYDPDIIESSPVAGGNRPNLTQARDAMNGTVGTPDSFPLRPTYESRWLVVYDRSNCVKPTDRPKILMQVELPPAKP